MKLAIVGSRTFDNYELLVDTIFRNVNLLSNVQSIVSGGATGADSLAERFAEEHLIEKIIFKPNWNFYGKSAGYKRNVDIVQNSDLVMVFWDGKSKGAEHDVKIAKDLKKQLIVVYYLTGKIEKFNLDNDIINLYI